MDNKEEKLDETKEKEVEDLKNEDVDATDAPQEEAAEATADAEASKPKDPKKDTKKAKKDEIAKLKEEIEKLKNDNLKLREDYLRGLADMENTKRRLNEDVLKQKKYASQGLVESLVTPVDMLDKVASMETESPELQNFLVGFKMISKQLIDILEADGLKEIDAKGKPFDANFHHAIEKEHVDGVEPNVVLEVKQAGYMYKDRLLRPAMVKVSE
ncbi:MAG: nucleotide exchange factor GrpE [Acholeplasmatales bacterium]|nr:nucleotide exchange factor GrpE [Acholeplasmatales bacterium]